MSHNDDNIRAPVQCTLHKTTKRFGTNVCTGTPLLVRGPRALFQRSLATPAGRSGVCGLRAKATYGMTGLPPAQLCASLAVGCEKKQAADTTCFGGEPRMPSHP